MSFKKTPIGEIPEDWEVVKSRKIISYIKGKKPKIIAKEPKDGWLPYLSTEYLRNNNPTQFVKITGNEITVEDGDILLLWDGSNAGEFFLAKKGVLSSTMVKIFLKKDVYDPLFLFYLLKHRELFLKGQTKGTGIPHVDKNVLNALLLPLPPLPEQKKIAEILRTVDEAIEKTDEAIERTEKLKRGLMQRLLTKGIKHERFKRTELGEIPVEWRVVRLQDVSLIMDCEHRTPEYYDNGIPVVRPSNIKPSWLTDKDLEKAPKTTYKEYLSLTRRYRPQRGDIIFSRNAKVGIASYVMTEKPFALGQDLVGIRAVDVDPLFLFYFMNSFIIRNQIMRLLTGSTFKRIDLKKIRNLKIPLPPLSEQKQIAEILSTVDRKLELLRQRREKLERVKRGLMKDLLTGRRRVRVE